jgi:hypothetical protein
MQNNVPPFVHDQVSKVFGYVYAIEMANNHVKIGCTRRPLERLSAIQTQAGVKAINMWVSHELADWYGVEHAVHRALRVFRGIGEYFNIEFHHAVLVIESIAPLELTEQERKHYIDINNELVLKMINFSTNVIPNIIMSGDLTIHNKGNCRGLCDLCIDNKSCEQKYDEEAFLFQFLSLNSEDDYIAIVGGEDGLTNYEIELLAQVRKRNEAYILSGLVYADRKKKLIEFSKKYRSVHIDPSPRPPLLALVD